MHCESLTAHNKTAAVKKEHLSNIIKVKFAEEKSYWNFCLRFFSCRGETQCVGNVHNGTSTRACCWVRLPHGEPRQWMLNLFLLWFSFKCFLYHTVSIMRYLDVNSVKTDFLNTFFPLSRTWHFETRPSPLSKIGENAFGADFLQLYRKNEYGDPHFFISWF